MVNETIFEKRESNTTALMNCYMNELFNEKGPACFGVRVSEYFMHLQALGLIGIDFNDLEHVNDLIREILNRFPKKLAQESIHQLLWLAYSKVPYDRTVLEIKLLTLPDSTKELVKSTIQEKYPDYYRFIENKW
jgi:hypothetical protein